MTRSNTRDRVGDVAVVAGVRPRTFMADLIYRLTPIDGLLDTEFASHLLRSKRVRNRIESIARGSSATMPKLTKSQIERACESRCPHWRLRATQSKRSGASLRRCEMRRNAPIARSSSSRSSARGSLPTW